MSDPAPRHPLSPAARHRRQPACPILCLPLVPTCLAACLPACPPACLRVLTRPCPQTRPAVFCCLPHATTQEVLAGLPGHVKVVDLSADFRLRDVATYAEWWVLARERGRVAVCLAATGVAAMSTGCTCICSRPWGASPAAFGHPTRCPAGVAGTLALHCCCTITYVLPRCACCLPLLQVWRGAQGARAAEGGCVWPD